MVLCIEQVGMRSKLLVKLFFHLSRFYFLLVVFSEVFDKEIGLKEPRFLVDSVLARLITRDGSRAPPAGSQLCSGTLHM